LMTTPPPKARNPAAQVWLLAKTATRAGPHSSLEGMVCEGVRIDALPLAFDQSAWQQHFLARWPAGSDAHASYWPRIAGVREATDCQAG
jgi:hypothetical protein